MAQTQTRGSKYFYRRCADHFRLVLETLIPFDHGEMEPSPVQKINNL